MKYIFNNLASHYFQLNLLLWKLYKPCALRCVIKINKDARFRRTHTQLTALVWLSRVCLWAAWVPYVTILLFYKTATVRQPAICFILLLPFSIAIFNPFIFHIFLILLSNSLLLPLTLPRYLSAATTPVEAPTRHLW